MRGLVLAFVAAAAIGIYAPALPAAPAAMAQPQNATPLTRAAQYWTNGVWYFDGRYYGDYRPACPWRYHYACRVGLNGYRHCACWPNY